LTDSPESPPSGKVFQKRAAGSLSTPLPDTSEPGGLKTATSARLAAGKSQRANDTK